MSESVKSGPESLLLRRERVVILAALFGLSALSWIYLVWVESAGMAGMGSAAVSRFALDFLMWCVMMAGMMLPSAAPMILTFATVSRRRRARGEVFVPSAVFVSGYLIVWVGFSFASALLDGVLAPKIIANPVFGGSLMLFAGVYQLTPLKYACLAKCRSPLSFLLLRWREGRIGALKMGLEHGLFCLGCCWLLMALLFVGGAMNLLWAAAIAAFVLVEKVLPQGLWTARASGALMIAFGLYLFSGPVFGAL